MKNKKKKKKRKNKLSSCEETSSYVLNRPTHSHSRIRWEGGLGSIPSM